MLGPSAVIGSSHSDKAGHVMVTEQTTRNSSSSASPRSPIKATHLPSSSPCRREPSRAPLATHAIVGLAVVLLALFLAAFAPHFPHSVLHFFTQDHHWRVSSPGITLRNPVLFQGQPPVCPKPQQQVEFVGTFNTRPKRSMALAEQAKRVAAEFDFGQDAVNKAVKEFIREMGMCTHTCWHNWTLTTCR